MRPLRTATCLVLTAAAFVVPSAGAATAPICNLITDPPKDTFLVRSQDSQGAYGPQEDALDLLSIDMGSDKTTLTGVMRMAKVATTASSAPGGLDVRISFTLPGQDPTKGNFFLNARTTSAGDPSFLLGLRTVVAQGQSTTAKVVDATGVFDTAKNEIRISVPLAAVKAGDAALKSGDKISFTGLDLTSARQVAVNPATSVGTATFADVTTADVSYVAGTKTCVTPGK